MNDAVCKLVKQLDFQSRPIKMGVRVRTPSALLYVSMAEWLGSSLQNCGRNSNVSSNLTRYAKAEVVKLVATQDLVR